MNCIHANLKEKKQIFNTGKSQVYQVVLQCSKCKQVVNVLFKKKKEF